MANWKKVIVSGSVAELAAVTASSYTGSFTGDGSGLTGVSGDFPTVHLGAPDAETQYFVYDAGSKFISGSQLSASIFGAVHGDVTIAADGTATVAAGVTQTADTASTVAITQHVGTPDPLYFLGVDGNGSGQNLYSTNQAGRSIFFDHGDSTLVVSDNLKIGDGTPAIASLSSSATTFNLLDTGVGTINFGGAASAISIGNATSLTTINDNLKVVGDLIVNGSTAQLEVTNLNVDDQFILLNSHSSATDASVIANDGGIIVQTSGSMDALGAWGTALYYDVQSNRWALKESSSANWQATTMVPDQFIVSVSSSAVAPTGTPDNFGNTDADRYGMMYVDTSDTTNGGLYIYLP